MTRTRRPQKIGRQLRNEPREAPAKRAKVRLLTVVVLVGFWASVVYHYIQGAYLGKPYPFNSFLFLPGDRFMDFFNDFLRAKSFIEGAPGYLAYTPFNHLVLTLLTPLGAGAALMVYVFAFLATVLFMLDRFLAERPDALMRAQEVFVLGAMSFPIVFVLDRGNEEMMIFVLMFWFLYFHYVDRKPLLSAVFLGAAIAMKIYAGVFLVLFLADREYLLAVGTFLGALLAELGSVVVLGMWSGMGLAKTWAAALATLGSWQAQYMLGLDSVDHRHTLWQLLTLHEHLVGTPQRLPALQGPYIAFAAVSFILIAVYVVFIEHRAWRRFTLLTVALLLLPYLSGVYNLIHVFLAVLLFANTRTRSRFDVAYTVLFGLLLVPLDYGIIVANVSMSTILDPLLLIALAGLVIYDRMGEPGPVFVGLASRD